MSEVGKGIDRIDARLKVTGKATYAAEFAVANVTHGAIVSAHVGKGKIGSIDTAAAEKAPGVVAVITHKNAPKLPGAGKKSNEQDRILQILQDDEVHYDDQPIALVVAETLEQARYAATLVEAKIDGQKQSLLLSGETPAPPEKWNRKPVDTSQGDFDKAFAGAKTKIEQTYTTPIEHHNPMETHATIAVWTSDDTVSIYDATQGISGVQKKVAALFGIPPEKVRVKSPYVGGGFGCKGSPWSHIGLAALAAKHTRRGVKISLTRQQMFSLVGHRPTTEQKMSLAADASGKLVALRHETLTYTSRLDEFLEPSSLVSRMMYACPNIKTSHRLVKLDVPTPTFTRAPGESTGSYALECAMDELAVALNMDPLQLRMVNYADTDPEENKPWSSKELRACYKQAAEKFGWNRRKSKPASVRDGHWLVGMGMASATYPANQSPSAASCRIRRDGTALVEAGTQDIGTGTYTIMTQIAADALGIPIGNVKFDLGDSNMPATPVSGGSQTASSTGSAVQKVCQDARAQLLDLAIADGPLKGAAKEELDVVDGNVVSKKGGKDPIGDIVKRSGKEELLVKSELKPLEDRKKHSCHSFGAQFAEVHVDEATGEVRVSRIVSAFAAGRILNVKTARSQYLGGIVWGIGMALHEHTVRDERNGRIVTRDLADYHVPVHADIPDIDVIMVDEKDDFVNPIGAKGIGEIGITGIGAAIANAIYNATGKRVRDLPITPEKLLG